MGGSLEHTGSGGEASCGFGSKGEGFGGDGEGGEIMRVVYM